METEYARRIRADKEGAEIAAKKGSDSSGCGGFRIFYVDFFLLYMCRKTGYAQIVKIAEKCLHFKGFYVMLSELWHDS
jgi:hypothetical protein